MPFSTRLKRIIFGPPRDPLKPDTLHYIAPITFIAWLGADVLSSSCYGPEEAFIALGEHVHLGLYLAIATAITVFVISLAYNEVIELFPSGGGGYKAASQLVGPKAGLVAGAALLVDYVLTIAISIASGADALFSLLPLAAQDYKLSVEIGLLLLLFLMNLRGMRESNKVLIPIFLGFFVSHAGLIVYGVQAHGENLPSLVGSTVTQTQQLGAELGWIFVISLFLKAYSLGGGTYTGLEAVSNNVNMLAEPRVKTGKFAMLVMAVTLSFTAGGVILLYLLWGAERTPGQTLNAVVFNAIIASWQLGDPVFERAALMVVLALETALLLVAANTGFLGGPITLANMAVDAWVPRHFRSLSSSLVTQYGIVLMGLLALGILLWTGGQVVILVVLYSINVFLTFTLSLLGLVRHWWQQRWGEETNWRPKLALALVGLVMSSSILAITLFEKFMVGGWLTVLLTGLVILPCFFVRRHYDQVREQLRQIDHLLAPPLIEEENEPPPPPLNPEAPTAVFLIGKNRGIGMHTLLWVERTFPDHFKNFLFLSAGEVDSQSFSGQGALRSLQYQLDNSLHYFTLYCQRHGKAAKAYAAYGTDPVVELEKLALQAMTEFPNSVCFASKLIFEQDNWLTPWLHNQTALAMLRQLHLQGRQMVIIPLKV